MVRFIACSKCHFENDENNEFCTNCGADLNPATMPAHTIMNSNSQRVMSGSYDAMPGAKTYGYKRNTPKILGNILLIIFIIIIIVVFIILYNTFFKGDLSFP